MAHKKTFYLYGGSVFSNLEKFAKELQSMTDDVFKHHVNSDKHDFKEWVKHSLKEEDLAQKLEDKIDKLEIELEVLRYLVHDNKPKKKASAKKTTKKVEKKSTKKEIVEKKDSKVKKKTPVKK